MLRAMEELNTERLIRPIHSLSRAAGPPIPSFLALKGPEKGATFPLKPGRSLLGRSATNGVVLLGAGISRVHAELEVGEQSVRVVDQGSTNGLSINGKKVREGELKAGDILEIGEVQLRLEFTDPTLSEVFQELYRGATRDSLTGLLNHRAVMTRIEEEWAAGSRHHYPSVLAMIDVDHFKSVNDTYGHPAGDAVLVKLAAILIDEVRTEDVVGRYGGEEFVALLRFAEAEAALPALNRLRERIASTDFLVPTASGTTTIRISASMGMSPLTPDSEVERALKLADQALYEAKRGGRNQVCMKEEPAP